MRRSGGKDGLSPAELEEARLGFNHYLRRKRFSAQFIARHGEELFATATLEYSRKLAEGAEIEHPAGWLINCAWQRTKSLLESEDRSPGLVSTERTAALTGELDKSAEEVALEEERFHKVLEAVEQLSVRERRLLALSCFEGMAVREAARLLHWHPSKAQRCDEAARRRLHDLLGVGSLDELELDLGLAAFLSLIGAGAGPHLPRALEAAVEATGRGTGHAWLRTQELARRFTAGGGTEPASAALGSGAGRAAGVCAAAALACLASGVVGPGVGGLLTSGHREAARAHRSSPLRTPPAAPSPAPLASAAQPEAAASPSGGAQTQRSPRSGPAKASRTRQAARTASSEFGIESGAGSSSEEAASTSSETVPTSTPTTTTTTSSPSSSPPPSSAKTLSEEFGVERK